MQTSQSVTFVKSVESTGSADLLRFVIAEEDNVSPLEEWQQAYYDANGEYPTTVRRSEVEEYAAILDETLTHSFSRKIRLYGADLVGSYDLSRVRASKVVKNGSKSGTASETVSLNGTVRLNLKYPIKAISSASYELVTVNGKPYTGDITLSESGALVFDDNVYGFAAVTYSHQWEEIEVTGLDTSASDKRPSYLIAKSDNGVDSIEISYPDVQDPESGIEPDDETYIKIWAHREKNNRAIRDPLAVTDYVEITRTISPVEIDGVQIERAATVTFRVGETDETIRLVFDLPLNQAPTE
ncbi:hypothetical protein [Vibrio phage vB_VhaS-a]|nr:hypothetical protein [Vibrio phage vB_VhaS-a]